jgi:hypothetical protein
MSKIADLLEEYGTSLADIRGRLKRVDRTKLAGNTGAASQSPLPRSKFYTAQEAGRD